ncbi:hypothetical protein CBR_g12474 [Chara braunii]|uniref:Uncharacterized protein n=1 Tax=Chara braunii TaxID=69332 RepID=A0A388JSG0_CHABU|nr:hypothetical protein CBR_g12474 [Chara braunii]|eukprot:GBG60736.1 hypothetical protein CBR_g12474 [Chara braunii]
MASTKNTSTSAGPSAPGEGRPVQQPTPQYMHTKGAPWFLDFVVQGDLFGPVVFMRPTCVTDARGAVNVVPLGTVVSCAKTPRGLLKLHTNGVYDECRLPIRGVKGVLVTIKSFAGYGSNMMLCSHFKGLYDGGSKHLPSPEQYLDLALMVPKERPVLPPEHVFRLLPPREGSSDLAQKNPGTAVGRRSPIQDVGGRVKGRNIHTQVGPDAPRNTSDLHSQGTGTPRVGTPKLIKVRCGADTYSLRDETRRDSSRSGLDVGWNEAEGMGAIRKSSRGEQTPSEKKSERQRRVRQEVAEGTLRMKRMRGKPEALMGGDGGGDGERASGKKPMKEEGGTTSKKARRPGGLNIREGQAAGGGNSVDPGAAAAREPSGKSKRKVAAEEGDGQKKPRRRKTAEAASGGEGPVGQECDEAAAFWLEYERNNVGEIVKKVHKDVFKPEDKDKYYYYPVNGQHTVAVVKEFEGEQIFDLWKMHSWPARVVWFSDRDFARYRQVSLNENTRHKMSKQRSQKAAFLDMRESEKEREPPRKLTKAERKALNQIRGGQGTSRKQGESSKNGGHGSGERQVDQGQQNQGQQTQPQGGRGRGRGRRNGGGRGNWQEYVCKYCDMKGHVIRFCQILAKDEKDHVVFTTIRGEVFDFEGTLIDQDNEGGMRKEAFRRMGRPLLATFRLASPE